MNNWIKYFISISIMIIAIAMLSYFHIIPICIFHWLVLIGIYVVVLWIIIALYLIIFKYWKLWKSYLSSSVCCSQQIWSTHKPTQNQNVPPPLPRVRRAKIALKRVRRLVRSIQLPLLNAGWLPSVVSPAKSVSKSPVSIAGGINDKRYQLSP